MTDEVSQTQARVSITGKVLEPAGLWDDEPDERKAYVEGQYYEVTLEDCCIEGTLIGHFLGREYKREDGEIWDVAYHFDFGSLGPDWGAWRVEPLEIKYVAVDKGEET